MKLDDTVCRGSLIIHKEDRLVVLGPGVHKTSSKYTFGSRLHTQQRFGWRVMEVSRLTGAEILVDSVRTIDKEEEVDTFFPGAVFEIPDYIR